MTKYLMPLAACLLLLRHTSHSQVHLSTGKAEADYTLFNYNDANRLSTNISLYYTAGGGVKVDDMGSDVGLGWEINTGGSIRRMQYGEPDDQQVSGLAALHLSNGILYGPSQWSTDCNPILGYLPLSQDPSAKMTIPESARPDRQRDIFVFTFAGYSGRFVINTLQGEVLMLDKSPLKVRVIHETPGDDIVTTISKFVITTDKGIEYVFSDEELSRVYNYDVGQKVSVFGSATTYLGTVNTIQTNYKVVQGWQLSEIVNPLTGTRIVYNYDSYDIEYLANRAPMLTQTPVGSQTETTIHNRQQRFKGTLKRINKILLPNRQVVSFQYSPSDRADLPGAKMLTHILVKNASSEILSGVQFDYQYFSKVSLRAINYAFPQEELPYARLSLKSYRKLGKGGVADNPFSFKYYQGTDEADLAAWVPARYSIMQDFWGYYNCSGELPYSGASPSETNNNLYKNLERFCSPNYRVAFNDPRRSSNAPNSYVAAKNGAIQSITLPHGGSIVYDYEYNDALFEDQVKVVGGVRVKSVRQSDGLNAANDIITEYKYVRADGRTSGWGYEEPILATQQRSVYIPAGGTFNVASLVNASALQSTINKSIFKSYDGQRIPRDPYQKEFPGVLTDMAINLISFFVQTFSSSTLQEINTTNISSNYLSRHNPLPYMYSRVEAYQGTVSNNLGKAVYEFTSDEDYPVLTPTLSKPYSSRPRYVAAAYGLLKSTKIFNKEGNPVKEIYNKYESGYDAVTSNFVCVPTTTILAKSSDYNANLHRIGFMTDTYSWIREYTSLTATTQKSYNIDGSFHIDRTSYEYAPQYNYLKKIVTATSNGETREKLFYYPQDYSITALTQMKNANQLAAPVSIETWLNKGGNRYLLAAEIQDFQLTGNGDFKPVQTYRLNAAAPVPVGTIGNFDATKLVRNNQYLLPEAAALYAQSGSPSQLIERGKITAMVYDDNGTVTIAEVQNAGIADVAYTSFENGQRGNWDMIKQAEEPQFAADPFTPTGSSCLLLNTVARISKSGLTTGKQYLLSFWYKGGDVNISGGTINERESGRTVNGWTYKSVLVSNTAAINLQGTGYIDELRLHPITSVMISTTHDENQNMSSRCSMDNIIVKFEYDELGRQKSTKDQSGNILTYADYKYKLQ